MIFLNKLGLLLSVREKVLNSFTSRLFPIKSLDTIPTPEKHQHLNQHQNFQKKHLNTRNLN